MKQPIKQSSIALAIAVSFLIGIYLFYLSFIYQDNTTGKFNAKQNPYHSKMRFKDEKQKQIYKDQWFPTQSEQLLFQVIDGFYFPWAINQEKQQEMKNSNDETNKNKYFTDVVFTEPINRLISEPKNTILMEAYADGPTLSAVRIKSILRGNMPLHIEVINNLRGVVMPDDNIVYQSKVNGQGKKVHFFGFMYWDQFVGEHFDKKFITDQEGYTQSMIDDQKIQDHIFQEQGSKDWGTIFSHYEALDMVVHGYSSVGSNTYQTVNFHSNLLKDLIDSTKKENIDAETIIYFSDHGQNEKHFAQHGGYTDLEKQVLLFGYDRRGFIQKQDRDIGQIMDREYLLSPKVNQIDVTATYCMLKGIPLPSVNIGVIIPDFFINKPEIDNTVIVNNYFVNVNQIYTYLSIIRNEKKRSILSFGQIQSLFDGIVKQYNNLFDTFEQSGIMQDQDVKQYVENCIKYARFVKKIFLDEISGPNLVYTNATVVYFFIAALSSFALIQILSSIQNNSYRENTAQQETSKSSKKIYIKTGIIIFVFIFGLISLYSNTLTSFLIFYAFGLIILFYFLKIQSNHINFKNLILPHKVFNSNLYGAIDTLLIISGIGFNAVLRMTNDFFERTYDLTQVFLLIFYAIWFLMVLFSKKISILQKLYLIILMIITPALTYECGYHSYYKNAKHNQFFLIEEYQQYFQSKNVRFYYPMTLLGFIYTILIYKSCKAINGTCQFIKKALFVLLCYSQLYCLFTFYYIQSLNIEKQEGKEVYDLDINYIFVAQILFVLTEVYKIIFINRTSLNPPNFSWKYATFLMNFYLLAMYVLHYDSLIKYSTLLLMVYFVGHLHNCLKIMESGSKYVFLYLLTSWFFYVSEHMERLPSLHTEVLNAGAMFGGIFYPLLNGTLNTFFGQFSISLIVPLFVLNEKYQINSSKLDQHDELKNISFLDVIFSNHSQIVFFSNRENIQDYYKNMNIRAYLYFIIPMFFSFATAILRNALKPFDYFINHYYVPSFFFQVLFLVVILISFLISYLLINLQNNKKLEMQFYDQLISEKAEGEFELEQKQESNI